MQKNIVNARHVPLEFLKLAGKPLKRLIFG